MGKRKVGFTLVAQQALSACCADIPSLGASIARELDRVPPKYAVDSADGLFIYGIEFSWIRENDTGTITIMTTREAKELDKMRRQYN